MTGICIKTAIWSRVAAGALAVSEQLAHAARTEWYNKLLERDCPPVYTDDSRNLALLGANEAALSLCGYARDELQRLSLKDLCPPDWCPAALRQRRGQR
jgi:PAS domain-containing protein